MNKIIIAIDTPDMERARHLMRMTRLYCGMFKFGPEAIMGCGVSVVHFMDHPFFLDLKWHDIPTTVANSITAALPFHPKMITIHASGGPDMIKAAREAAEKANGERPLIIAVTRLTHLHPDEVEVLRLARGAIHAGADGVVCAPRHLKPVRHAVGLGVIVTPGIRPEGYPNDDQFSTMTPKEAFDTGSDWLVVGRPVTKAWDVEAAAKALHNSVYG